MPVIGSGGQMPAEAALARLADMGIPVVAGVPFYRMGEPFPVPVAPEGDPECGDEFMLALPRNVTSFMYTNNNPFAVRLRGRRDGQPFVRITKTSGWLWLPGTSRVFTSLRPISLSAMSVDGPNAAVQAAQRAGRGFVELQYGVGGP